MLSLHVPTTTDTAARTGVGIVGTAYAWLQMPLSTWVALATLAYMLCQLIVILPKVFEALDKLKKKIFKRRTNGKT